MNATQPYEHPETYSNAISHAIILSYFICFVWTAANWGNRPGARAWTTIGQIVAPLPPVATGWRHIGEITFSANDVKPPVMQSSPLYERTYASGKKSWRFWDDVIEEWVYHAAFPTDVLST